MYNINYVYRERTSSKKIKRQTEVNIQFRFRQDIAPKDRKELKDRLRYNKNQKYNKQNIRKINNIAEYLVAIEKCSSEGEYGFLASKFELKNFVKYLNSEGEYGTLASKFELKNFVKYLNFDDDYKKEAKILVKPFPRRLGLNLKIKADGRNNLEDILDIETLNKFLLTGKIEKVK